MTTHDNADYVQPSDPLLAQLAEAIRPFVRPDLDASVVAKRVERFVVEAEAQARTEGYEQGKRDHQRLVEDGTVGKAIERFARREALAEASTQIKAGPAPRYIVSGVDRAFVLAVLDRLGGVEKETPE
jgi:hypothetical protein